MIVFLGTMLGWAIVHFLTKKRDSSNKKKEIQIDYLIKAWNLLESASNRRDNNLNKNIETALANIQLFGTKSQILLTEKIADDISSKGKADVLDLLIELRKELRKELNIDQVTDTFKFIRFE